MYLVSVKDNDCLESTSFYVSSARIPFLEVINILRLN